ncbi:HhH-GPD domain-containing protein [Cephalotus follicularis]|uniref:HhH-GPD domain-containing protein n=1 Tax=Cephalotus follicularis TaxID=3775 RepID=A0A1Q3ARQ1_CEPFO|nr:HhH-GPD domain-containing protein [Cephalotus follicularis]
MNSRMNIGDGIPFQQENEFQFLVTPWIPVTPEKPVRIRSNPIPVEGHGNQLGGAGWQQLPRFSNGYIPDMSNYNRLLRNFNQVEQVDQNGGLYGCNGSLAERKEMINHIAGSYTQALRNQSLTLKNAAASIATANTTPSVGVGWQSIPLIPNLISPVDDWRESNSANMLLANQFRCYSDSLQQIPQCSDLLSYKGNLHRIPQYNTGNFEDLQNRFICRGKQTNNLAICSEMLKMKQASTDGFPIPYNQQLPPTEAHAASSVTTPFPLTPVTPVQAKNLKSQQLSATQKFSADCSSQEKDKQLVTSSENEAFEQNSNELLQDIVDSSSAVISTPVMEKKDSDGGGDRGIDLNKTPQQKTPKRRKHRPKVIVEGKRKRILKPSTPENPTGKRRYVPKKSLKEPETQQVEIMSEISAQTAAKTCKRVLNFDSENARDERQGEVVCPQDEMQQWKERALNLISEPQVTEFCTTTNSGCGTNSIVKRKYVRKENPRRSQLVHSFVASKENPTGKRKYIRKKGLKESITQKAEIPRETKAETATESCRIEVNLDLENTRNVRAGEIAGQWEVMKQWNEKSLLLNSESQVTDLYTTGSGCRTNSTMHMGQQNRVPVENQQPRVLSDLPSTMNQMPSDHRSILERQHFALASSTQALQISNLNVISRNRDERRADPCQNSKDGFTLIQQHSHAEGNGQIAFQSRSNRGNLDRTRQLMSQSTSVSAPKILANVYEARGSKGEHQHALEQIHPRTANSIGSLLCQEKNQRNECDRNGIVPDSGSLETHKRKKIENGVHTTIYGLPCVTEVKDSSEQLKTKRTNDVNANGITTQRNHKIVNPRFESGSDWYMHSMASVHNFLKQHISSEPDSCLRINRLTQVHNFASQTIVDKCNLLPPTPPKMAPARRDGLVSKTSHTNVSEQKQTAEPILSKSVSSKRGRVLQDQKEGIRVYQQSSARPRGRPLEIMDPIPVDEIIYRLNGLNLNGRSNHGAMQEQSAIVPYRGDGTIVPYGEFELIKRRRPRPKVDLDPETNRLWNLLMGKEGSEGIQGTDMEKEKWWDEERKVFVGRADSFIARMHLVQGDRRFSKWKGSVVDSVIGVFLTQNVSDHLSSSAFMSLAARFPLKPNRACNWDRTSILVEEPEVWDINPNDAIKRHEKESNHSLFDRLLTASDESIRHRRGSENTDIVRTSLAEAHSHSFEEEVLSSQDSSIIQVNGGIKTCSSSNPEAEDPTNERKPNKINSSTIPTQILNPTSFEEFYSRVNKCPLFQEEFNYRDDHLNNLENSQQKPRLERIDSIRGSSTFTHPIDFNNPQIQTQVAPPSTYQLHTTSHSDVLDVESHEMYGKECISSWPSTASGFSKAKEVNCARIKQVADEVSKITVELNGLSKIQEIQKMDPKKVLSQHPMHQQSIAQLYDNGRQHEKNKTLLLSRTSVPEHVNLTEVLTKQQISSMKHIADAPKVTERTSDAERTATVNMQIHLQNRWREQNSQKQVDSTAKAYNEIMIKGPKAKKGKAEDEKNTIDWDNLRRQVHANVQKNGRSKDTMDSLDYEAIRIANVNEISDAIKERGMNNMLAERIKDFLNRLVREHGSIDLEWLRDVPPEKVKDYLLSIRGLGLKSVECVRLLTLQHLAFPVDTNVGRIAVRLGWVPLQPLPESLQLHLLELYPVLESIQKYLWPRLCKLDQRTLYELHYQMITFGKVFCTKSKPNCNACPMRGECRHFASAFASARLALPGPEEKSIVSSTAHIRVERSPNVVVSSMPPPLPEYEPIKEAGSASEPIIEEPVTPEQENKEISESDIEDMFYDDPDEIPTIKLNIEEFTVNLQSYMQEKMELQEGDLSKALVALNSEAASIPTPKLKNVSRLRTEHHVYELPDSHPLLNKLDRREPDDPSPYLLAIWTPGETSNSILPPEQGCGSLEAGKLCNDYTCFSCNSIREANSQTVRGTILVPCRTAMRGSFPLNGTYFQVNEVFADHESSLNPIDVPREWIWNLPRRVVYFGTSVSTIFKGLSTEGIQYCFWRGFVCVRGFDQKTRAPRPLKARLHFPASKLAKTKK